MARFSLVLSVSAFRLFVFGGIAGSETLQVCVCVCARVCVCMYLCVHTHPNRAWNVRRTCTSSIWSPASGDKYGPTTWREGGRYDLFHCC